MPELSDFSPPDGFFFDGEPCVLDPSGQAAAFLDRLWPEKRWPFRDRRSSEGFAANTLKTSKDLWFESPYPVEPLPGVNEVIIPAGAARYARALILVNGEQMRRIANRLWGLNRYEGYSRYGTNNGNWGPKQNFSDLVVRNGGRELTWSMTPLTPLFVQEGKGDWDVWNSSSAMLKHLWLLPLVDRRYFLQRMRKQVNISNDATWWDLFDQLEEKSGFTIHRPTVDDFDSEEEFEEAFEAYLVPDAESFNAPGVAMGHLIDAAALSIGMRAVPTENGNAIQLHGVGPITVSEDGELDTVPYSALKMHLDNHRVIDIEDHDPEVNPFIPGRYMRGFVLHPRAAKPIGLELVAPILRNYFPCTDTEVIEVSPLPGIDFVYEEGEEPEEDLPEETDGDSLEKIVVFTTHWAKYDENIFDEINQTQLNDLADKLALDLSEWAEWAFGKTIAGVAEWQITGYDDYLAIGFHGRALTSQIRQLPQDFYPRIQFSQSPAFFRHLQDSIIGRLVDNVSELTFETIEEPEEHDAWVLGSGPAIPVEILKETNELADLLKSDGSPIEIIVYNGSKNSIEATEEDHRLVHCKNLNCYPVIDVEYCG